ncbi:nitrate reductase molybdenum cofactor assembly chaperone [Jonesia quinghaiensis]|uniref:nitrate reductase molybdenum cofactor assembly chaperone n=1 Tax=Jonesia quinghaiensis TaxID=262806 RepID=UPI000415E8AE|nr:nitrate reductase molybdenum cofactor assembly chaperone [Jonesia quinghaiensis]
MSTSAKARKPIGIPLFRRSQRRNLTDIPGRAEVLALSAVLLGYPDEQFDVLRSDLTTAIGDLPQSPAARLLQEFWVAFSAQTSMQAQRHYVETFDMRRKSSLFLTYYLHGDTRQRGMSLLMFKQRYRAYGFSPPENELPDYLPMVLEFAAVTGSGVGEGLLRLHRNGFEVIRTALHDRTSMYAMVLDAVAEILGPITERQQEEISTLVAAGPPAETIGLESPLAPYSTLSGGPDQPFGPPEFTCSPKGN